MKHFVLLLLIVSPLWAADNPRVIGQSVVNTNNGLYGVTASSTTTKRDIQDRLLDFGVNAKDMGANGHGIDDTDELQAVINKGLTRGSNGNAIVYLPAGFFNVSRTLVVDGDFVTIRGVGSQPGGNGADNVIGTTINATASGMDAIMVVTNSTGNGIVNTVNLENVRFRADPGLVSPPDGVRYWDSTICFITDCYFGENLVDGLEIRGTDQMFIRNSFFQYCTNGIRLTAGNAGIFVSNSDVDLINVNIDHCTYAGVLMDNYGAHRIRFDGGWFEDNPIGMLVTPRAGFDLDLENLHFNNTTFFQGASTPYPNNRALVVAAPSGAANYLAVRNVTFEDCIISGYGSTNLIDFLISSNSNPATTIKGVSIKPSNLFYGVSDGAIYSDSNSMEGYVHGSEGIEGEVVVRAGYHTGAAKPLFTPSSLTNGWARYLHVLPPPFTFDNAIVMLHDNKGRATNAPMHVSEGTNVAIRGFAPVGGISLVIGKTNALAEIDVRADAAGNGHTNGAAIMVSTEANGNPASYGFANGGTTRGLIVLPTSSAPMQFISTTTGGRSAGWEWLQQSNIVASIGTGGFITISGLTNTVVTGDRVAIFDSAKRLTNSTAITPTELDFLDGVTTNIITTFSEIATQLAVSADGYTELPVVTTTDSTATPIMTNTPAINTMSVVHGEIYAMEEGIGNATVRTFAAIFVDDGGALTAAITDMTPNQANHGAGAPAWDVTASIVGGTVGKIFVDNNDGLGTTNVKWKLRYKVVTHTY